MAETEPTPSPEYRPGDRVRAEVTTDVFNGRVVRKLRADEIDWDDVGDMYEVAVHVYEGELKPIEEPDALVCPRCRRPQAGRLSPRPAGDGFLQCIGCSHVYRADGGG